MSGVLSSKAKALHPGHEIAMVWGEPHFIFRLSIAKEEYRQLTPQQAGATPSAIAMTGWYQEHGYDEDIEALVGAWGVPTLTFDQWLRTVWLPRRSAAAG